MSNHWTKEQEEALSVKGRNLLLSAAAGSGKTAVLTERIARLVKDPENHINMNELLVLTFTKAAASEMKARISAALADALKEADKADDEELMGHLEKQIALLGSAQISTLDSYFQSLIHQYFYLLDLDPKMRILSDEMRSSFWRMKCFPPCWRTGMKGRPPFSGHGGSFCRPVPGSRAEGNGPPHFPFCLLPPLPR